MDYYKVLGLDKNATKSEIKDAYRRLALKHHPYKQADSSKSVADSAAIVFNQISVAYNLLSDDSKRADYDFRHSGSSSSSSSCSSSTSFNNCNIPGCKKQSENMGYRYRYGEQSSCTNSSSYNTCAERGLMYIRDYVTAGGYQRPFNSVGVSALEYEGAALKYEGAASKAEGFARYFTKSTRDFYLGAAFLGIILGGTVIIDKGRGLLWKLQNSGKSFEAAMDNIQKAKADKEKE